jgi:iron complex transport system substrate-binding protein
MAVFCIPRFKSAGARRIGRLLALLPVFLFALAMEPVAKRSFATPTELVGCVRNVAGRGFGASCMLKCSNGALGVHFAAPDADGGVEDADKNLGFARDSMGRPLSGQAAVPKRVVSQAVGTDDLLLALAGPGQIAALSHLAHDPLYAPDAASARRHPKLGSSSAEDILRFKPDLVLMTSFSSPESVAVIKKSGIRLYVLEKYETLEDTYESLRRLGALLGQGRRADALVASCRARVAALQGALEGAKPKRVASAGVYPYISGAGTSFQDICDHAGAVNVAAEAGISGVVPIPAEKMLSWDIDALVGPTEHAPGERGPSLRDRLKDVAPFRYLKAHREGRVIEIPGALFAATSHHRVAAYETLARALHPECFGGGE